MIALCTCFVMCEYLKGSGLISIYTSYTEILFTIAFYQNYFSGLYFPLYWMFLEQITILSTNHTVLKS